MACLTGCDRSNDSNSGDVAGVAGTGNAGRVAGVVRLADLGVQADTRLLRVEAGRSTLVSSHPTDSAGVFVYDSIPTGTYTVEAWQEGLLAGRSAEFVVTSATSQIVIVLVKPVFVHLDLRALGNVDSAYLDYPGNPVFKSDSLWTLRDVAVDSIGYNATLFTKVANGTGTGVWLSWKLANVGGRLELAGLVQGPVATIHSVDSGSYYPTRHTMALWTFDSITPDGRIKDLSPHRNDLIIPYTNYLVPSPHGKALSLARLPMSPIVRVVGDTLPVSLQWWNSDYQTIRIRLKLDKPITEGYQIFGTYKGLLILINADRQLQLLTHSGDESNWFWYEYKTMTGFVDIGKWMEITITRDAQEQTFAVWKNETPMPLFAMEGFGVEFVKSARDTFEIAGGSWDLARGPFQFDEIEISDTMPLPGALFSQPCWSTIFGHAENEIRSFTFGSVNSSDSSLVIDSSSLVDVGSNRSLFMKIKDLSALSGQSIIYSVFSIDLSEWTATPQKYGIYKAYASFEEKIARKQIPKPGIDYSESPINLAKLTSTALEPIITTLTAEWAADTSKNHGVVIQPIDKSLPDRTFKIQHDPSIASPYLGVYMQ